MLIMNKIKRIIMARLGPTGLTQVFVEIKNWVVSKLSSKANDSDVVHKSGNETINGIKYFTSGPQVTNNQTTMGYSITNTALARNDVPSEYYHHSFRAHDKNYKILGEYCIEKSTTGDTLLNMGVRSEDVNGNQIANSLLFKMTNNGSVVKFIPSANNKVYLGDEGAKWLKVYSDDVVHTSGDETIEGVKTFTGSPFVSNYATTNGYFTKNNLIARNEVPSQIYHSAFRVFDKNAKTLGEYCVEKSTSGSSLLHMDVHTEDANGNDLMESLYLNLSNDGSTVSFYPGKNNRTDLGMLICKWANVYATNFYGDLVGNVTGNATSATKATQDASGNVITTTYATKTENNLKANNSDVVHLTGNETINGTKTFSAAKFNISAADIAAIIV